MRINMITVLFLISILVIGFAAVPVIFGSLENEHPMENDTYAQQYEGLTESIMGAELIWWIAGFLLIVGLMIFVLVKASGISL